MVTYLLFIASLAAITAMIGIRIYNIRKGVAYEHRIENHHLPEINLAAVKNTASFYGKQYGHMLVLLALRGWIKASYFMKRKAKELEPKLKKLLTPKRLRHDPTHQTPVSHFLKSVSDYKQKVQRAHEHMKREEEAREEETGTL